MSETIEGRLERVSRSIRYAFAEGLITVEFYQDLAHLLWQAKKTPELEKEVIKLNHAILKLQNGRVMKECGSDQLKIKLERKRLEEVNKSYREVLAFYGDEENYVKEEWKPLNPKAKSIKMSAIEWDDGEKARGVL